MVDVSPQRAFNGVSFWPFPNQQKIRVNFLVWKFLKFHWILWVKLTFHVPLPSCCAAQRDVARRKRWRWSRVLPSRAWKTDRDLAKNKMGGECAVFTLISTVWDGTTLHCPMLSWMWKAVRRWWDLQGDRFSFLCFQEQTFLVEYLGAQWYWALGWGP